MNVRTLIAGLTIAGSATLAQAHVGGFDMMPYLANGQIQVGGITHSTDVHPITGVSTAPNFFTYKIDQLKVVALEFDDAGDPTFIGDPGVNYSHNTTLVDAETGVSGMLGASGLGNTTLFLEAVTGLQVWDHGSETFSLVTDDTQLKIQRTPSDFLLIGQAILDGSLSQPVTNANGNLHAHYSSFLFDGLIDQTAVAPSGIYAFQAKFTSSDAGIADSEAFWIVYNYWDTDDEFEHALAILTGEDHDHDDDDDDDDHHHSPVPEPASLSLLAIGAAALVVRRRR